MVKAFHQCLKNVYLYMTMFTCRWNSSACSFTCRQCCHQNWRNWWWRTKGWSR